MIFLLVDLLQRKVWLLSVFVVMGFFSAHALAGEEASALPYMAWKMIEQHKMNNDGMLSRVLLSLPEGAVVDQEIEVYYQVTPRQRRGSVFKEGEPAFYAGKLKQEKNGFSLSIESGSMEKITLLARTIIDGRPAYAQTLFYSFGNSGLTDQKAVSVDRVSGWPQFDIGFDQSFYRAQTGEPISLRLKDSHRPLGIFENGRTLGVELAAEAGGIYRYTPLHRDSLSRRGFRASDDLVFVADLKEQGVISLYLPLYRSLYGNSSLFWGLMILSGSVLVCLGLIWRADRRFAWR